MGFHEYFGIAAGILGFSACPIYARAILRGETRPDRVTWWILALVSGMIAASYYASGARDTIWLPVGYTTSFLVIASYPVYVLLTNTMIAYFIMQKKQMELPFNS